MTEMGTDTVTAEHEEWNGKAEVFDANLHEGSFDAHRIYDVAEMRRRLEVHLRWYDHARAHHALGGLLVPVDRYYGRSAEVLARIEAGAGRDAGDGVALRERCLEPFNLDFAPTTDGMPESEADFETYRCPARGAMAPPSRARRAPRGPKDARSSA